ncbi:MAG TPA: TetR/AcrR family transcriptional regulator [Streptosporangiaceae bacterium]|nr:TetR/AcrR family transcriptional regulator [Streptosporangiaceae bacterium]
MDASRANLVSIQADAHLPPPPRGVARAVGIAATSVYLHFPGKASLLLAVYQRHSPGSAAG